MVARCLSVLLCVLGAGLALTAAAQQTGVDLAKARNCLSCHQVDKKVVGPAFTVIAQRFAGSEAAADYLAQAIRDGGRGRWGPVPMPAQPQVSPADAKLLAAWILSLAEPTTAEPQAKE
ncbi:c-type cytochrome [Pollutimonas harenae]|uniref:C-type cytochrome n=1 Tax=Pollutimonas harenae TaxID=657015 RepID=A0A853H241_9BURK|nr:c-type cytochrome [Pollutimonas harenae]NYT87006.1 c-type cytochrome [Pollutimonas harenae]TEA69305.1 c-type cytochrome [Pollutimonas harenae]